MKYEKGKNYELNSLQTQETNEINKPHARQPGERINIHAETEETKRGFIKKLEGLESRPIDDDILA